MVLGGLSILDAIKVRHSNTPMTDPPNLWAGLHDSQELRNFLLYTVYTVFFEV